MTEREELDQRVERLLRDAAPRSFEAGFSHRVIAKLHADEAPLASALERQFLRIVPILAAASLVMGAYNWWSARETSSSVISAVLRLPEVTLANAYTTDALFNGAVEPAERP
jgi:hypothetical protein